MSCNHISECPRCGDEVEALDREIESLRSECKRLIHERAFEQQCKDEQYKWRQIAEKQLKHEKARGDEWKRRALRAEQEVKEHRERDTS